MMLKYVLGSAFAAMCRAEVHVLAADQCQSMCTSDQCCCNNEALGGPVCDECSACESADYGKTASFMQREQAPSKCPSKEKPKLLYNHITKTGGAAVKELLMAAVPLDDWKVEENVEDARLTPQKKDQSFVIGLVRRPCDYLVSWYYQLKSKCDTKADETDHLNCDNNGVKSKLAKNLLGFVNDTEASAPHRMSVVLEDRYGDDNVHCMMRTHNLKADFIDCMGKYQACGGTINNETTLDELADKALRKAAGIAHEAGRSVGNHPACTDLFDKDLEAAVLATEQSVVNKYNLETCCSVDKHQ